MRCSVERGNWRYNLLCTPFSTHFSEREKRSLSVDSSKSAYGISRNIPTHLFINWNIRIFHASNKSPSFLAALQLASKSSQKETSYTVQRSKKLLQPTAENRIRFHFMEPFQQCTSHRFCPVHGMWHCEAQWGGSEAE